MNNAVQVHATSAESVLKGLFPEALLSKSRPRDGENFMARFQSDCPRGVNFERRRAERVAESTLAKNELDSFCYAVSHDLRTPLRAIEGFSQALLADYQHRLDAQGKGHLQRIRNAALRMSALMDDLLNLTRYTRSEIRPVVVDLSAEAASILSELRKADPNRKSKVTIMPGLTARGDIHFLRVVLHNLLENAWKFTGGRAVAEIEFGAKEQDGRLVYFLRDNGAGFDPRFSSNLFRPFQRLHMPDEFPGLGMGLAVVDRIVRRHGGRAWATGRLDAGASVFFTLGE